jgi:hypothetical protein
MKEFMLIFRNEGGNKPTDEQMQQVLKQWQEWITGIAKSGNYSGTNRLYPEGKVVRPGKTVTDGPFVETREIFGGYLIVKTNSINDAVELAKSCPAISYGGSVEVRPVMAIDSEPTSKTFLEEKAYA